VLMSLRRFALPAFLLLLAGSAAAQDTTLDNTWFKLKIKIKGQAAVPDTEDPHKVTLSQTAYLHLTATPADSAPADGEFPTYSTTPYAYELWTETAPDVWTPTYAATADLQTASETDFYFADFFITVNYLDGAVADNYTTIAISVKFDKQGVFKNASIKSLGGETYQGTVTGDDALRGGITITGKTVPLDKLPFEIA